MANENETFAEIMREMRGIKGGQHANGGLSFERWRARCQIVDDYADRIEAAHKREIAVKDAEIARLRALIKEMADALWVEDGYSYQKLIAKAREVKQ